MTFTLRPYQTRLIDDARAALVRHPSALVQLPTGGGKTAIAAYMVGRAAERERRSWFVVHRQELVDQTAEAFAAQGIPVGFCASGYPWLPGPAVTVCSVDTLRHRQHRLSRPALVIWDEAHHTAAKTWAKLRAELPGAKHVGLTATPERLDGKGLRDHFATMVQGPTVAELIAGGFLADYDAYAPAAPDLTGVKKRAGDFAQDQIADLMDRRVIIGDAVKHYRKLADGKRAIVFAVNIAHSEHIVDAFRAAGIMALHIDGKMDRRDRRSAIDAFRAGQVRVLSNVALVGEGFDLPAVEAAILMRPTASLALYLQQVGRALRPSPGKRKALILDHAGNLARHGLPDDDREWSLEGRDAKARAASNEERIRRCPACFHVHAPRPACPECGHRYTVAVDLPETEDGELEAVDKDLVRRQRLAEQSQARSLEQLVELGRARGYRSPEKWAAHIWSARQAKRKAA